MTGVFSALRSGPIGRRFHRLFGNGEEGERGVFAILAAIVMTVMVFATALSVDIMGRVSTLRTDQATADIAALDAAWELGQPTPTLAAAQGLACPNGVANGVSCSGQVVISWGNASGLCNTSCTNPTTVTATVTTVYTDAFGRSHSSLSRNAVAQIASISNTIPCTIAPCSQTTYSTAQFSMGATLAEINAGLGRFSQANLSVLGYQGLATGSVSLGALATDLGFSALSVNGVLGDQLTMGTLLTQYASLLNNNGDSAAGAALSALDTYLGAHFSSTLQATATIGQFLGITSGNGMTLGTSVSFLQLFNGALQIANGKAGISLNLGVPGVANASVTAIQPPTVSPDGQPGVQATNSQVTATMTGPSISLGLVSLPLNLSVNVGGATGTLSSIDGCGTTASGIHVSTAFNNATIAVSGAVNLLGIDVTVSGTIFVPGLPPTTNPTSVPNTADFVPQTGVATASSAGLGTVTNNLQVNVLSGLVSLNVSTVLAAIPVGQIINALLNTTALSGIGINVGNAAYQGLTVACGGTNQITTGTTTTVTSGPQLIH